MSVLALPVITVIKVHGELRCSGLETRVEPTESQSWLPSMLSRDS